jgi:protein gp37
MGDLFHDDVPFLFIEDVFRVMLENPWHTFQVLTKRPERALLFLNDHLRSDVFKQWPFPNVWVGVSAENQEAANERIPWLMRIPAVVRFVSAEPLLGPIDLTEAMYGKDPHGMNGFGFTDGYGYEAMLHWIIVGGESGPNARPMHRDWAATLRDQCVAAQTPFMLKQWGEWADGLRLTPKGFTGELVLADGRHGPSPESLGFHGPDGVAWNKLNPRWMAKVGKQRAGRLLDGEVWDQYPRFQKRIGIKRCVRCKYVGSPRGMMRNTVWCDLLKRNISQTWDGIKKPPCKVNDGKE